jgi:hypothetical protein
VTWIAGQPTSMQLPQPVHLSSIDEVGLQLEVVDQHAGLAVMMTEGPSILISSRTVLNSTGSS